MRRPAALVVALLLLAGCGGEDDEPSAPPTAESRGYQLTLQSGCLACHRLGGRGNRGPGESLDGIGARQPRSAIARALISPKQPMPSFADLPPRDLDAIVEYLASLR